MQIGLNRIKVDEGLFLYFPGDAVASWATYAGRADGTKINLSEEKLYYYIKWVMYNKS